MTARLALLLVSAGLLSAAPRVDNVLEKMTPPDATSLVGARMDSVRATDLYRRLVEAGKLPEMDRFAAETGFDPRRDVRELLFVTTPRGRVLLARGTFRLHTAALKNMTMTRHGEYEIRRNANGGFCILDSTLAAAGDVAAIEEALDEWKSGSHTAAQKLLAKMGTAGEQGQIWGISTGAASFLADSVPLNAGGIDFSKIFRGLDDVWFTADLSAGLKAQVHGTTATEKDAMNLRDAVRGLVGMGRLSVPDNQPEMLRLWDGIVADQAGRSVTIRADIAQDLVQKLVEMLGAAHPGGRGAARDRI